MKRIVWDWNGTLFNDVDLCLDCINKVLVQHGLSPLKDLKAYREVFGFPIEDYYRAVGFDFSQTSFSQLAHEYMDLYQDQSYHCHLAKDAKKAIETAEHMKIDQTILSASKKDYLLLQIHAMGLDTYPLRIFGITDIYAHSKLALAKSYLKLCNGQDEVWFVGDSFHDYEVASQTGANCLLVTTGHQSRSRLSKAPVPVVDSLMEGLEIIYEGNTNHR